VEHPADCHTKHLLKAPSNQTKSFSNSGQNSRNNSASKSKGKGKSPKSEQTQVEVNPEAPKANTFEAYELSLSKQMWFSTGSAPSNADRDIFSEIKTSGQVPDAGTYPNLFGWVWAMGDMAADMADQNQSRAKPVEAKLQSSNSDFKKKVKNCDPLMGSSNSEELETRLAEGMTLSGGQCQGDEDITDKRELEDKTLAPDPSLRPIDLGWVSL
jgi:hypothetical protein